jgi:hypothetical protein
LRGLPKLQFTDLIVASLRAACCLKIRKFCFDAKFSSELFYLFLENVAFAM